ncbi:MAG: prepilin-type N-terminal cleavage/methylation domain-containing protein [Candidatus Dormibacteraeota bacterium]|nr:prepilin-type N-terminal cleavage/methylation domain-containing protein [Candidatus Dormibacteraeota bacterium]
MEEQRLVTGTRIQPQRNARRSEVGLTLIEIIVSMVLMTLVAGVIASVYSIGIKAVSPTGPQARMFGAHDLSILEQSLGQDGARASCIQVPGGTQYGSCDKVPSADCPASSTILCFAWPQVSDASCHVAVYTVGASTTAQRVEYKVGGASPLASVPLARAVRVNITVGTPVQSPPQGETYHWIRALPITIAATVVTNAPAQQLTLQPIATDPAGANAALPGGTPC